MRCRIEAPAAQISVRRAVEAVPLMADKIGAADFAEILSLKWLIISKKP